MEQNKIPVTIRCDQNEVVGATIIFTEDFEKTLLNSFKNHIPLSLGGLVNLSNDKIISLSIGLDMNNEVERR